MKIVAGAKVADTKTVLRAWIASILAKVQVQKSPLRAETEFWGGEAS